MLEAVYLYSIMRSSVYVLKESGVLLPRPRDKVFGNLLLQRDGRGDGRWLGARLTDNNVDLLRPLIHAQVLRISNHGIVIRGTELVTRTNSSKSSSVERSQIWWAFVVTEQAVTQFDGDDPLENLADMAACRNGVRSSGF